MSKRQPTAHVVVQPFDFKPAAGLVDAIAEGLWHLDGVTPPQPNGSAPGSGEMSRDLLNLADQLDHAAALVRNQYWTWKGGLSL